MPPETVAVALPLLNPKQVTLVVAAVKIKAGGSVILTVDAVVQL